MRAIYSLKITCDGDSVDKSDAPDLGFYVDDIVQTNPPMLLWCESKLASSGVTTIDGALATAYAPLIMELSELARDCEPDSPVVNTNSVTITLGNHDKIIEFLREYDIEILGLNARLSLNIFNASGVLTSSELKLDGKIEGLNYTDTICTGTISANKFARNAQLLSVGEQLLIGQKPADTVYCGTTRNSVKTIYTTGGQDAFMLIGGYDTITSSVKQRTYQVFFKTGVPSNISNLVGWWMYVESSSTESRGEYRKITSIESITGVEVDSVSISNPAIIPYMGNYTGGGYVEIEIDGAYTEGLVVDLCTYVKFVNFDHSFTLSKNALTGTVDRLYSQVDGEVVPFGNFGYDCVLNTNGTIDVSVDYPIDDDVIATYTGAPCRNLALIGNNISGANYEINLREWVYEAGDAGVSGDPYKNMNDLYAEQTPFTPGVFSEGGPVSSGLVTNDFGNSGGIFDHNVATYGYYRNTFTNYGNSLVGIQFDLPIIADDFKFKSVHLALAIKSTCPVGLATPSGIVCLTKQAYGAAVKHFNMPLDSSSGPVYINTVPEFYLTSALHDDFFYPTDWQWKTPDTAPQTRFTGLESTKLQGVDTVEKYRKILKVGLFFLRGPGTPANDEILLYEIAAIFKHENSLTGVFV